MSLADLWLQSYSLALLVAVASATFFGLKLMLSGLSSPEKKVQAQEFAQGFIYFTIFGILSFILYGLYIEFINAVGAYMISPETSLFVADKLDAAAVLVLQHDSLVQPYAWGSIFAMTMLAMQRILVVLGVILLPFAVGLAFLTFSSSLRSLGYALLTFFFIVGALQLVDSLLFVATAYAFQIMEHQEYALVAMYWLLGIVNLTAFKAAFTISQSGRGQVVITKMVEHVRTIQPAGSP